MTAGRSPREEELLNEGWTKRFCASGPRIQEATELYESMGLDVHLEPIRAEDLGCPECFQGPPGALDDCFVIYTRQREKTHEEGAANTHRQDEDLW